VLGRGRRGQFDKSSIVAIIYYLLDIEVAGSSDSELPHEGYTDAVSRGLPALQIIRCHGFFGVRLKRIHKKLRRKCDCIRSHPQLVQYTS
jgi:hypothetical protein